jgi:hypothetical protein
VFHLILFSPTTTQNEVQVVPEKHLVQEPHLVVTVENGLKLKSGLFLILNQQPRTQGKIQKPELFQLNWDAESA